MASLLEVKDLRTYFYGMDGTIKAVDGVTFDVQEGETLGLVGESGCGKSVCALSILRLIPDPPGEIVEGEIHFEGQDLLKLSNEAMRQVRGNRIAMIFQEPMTSLNPVLTVGRQLAEPLEVHRNMALQRGPGKVQGAAGQGADCRWRQTGKGLPPSVQRGHAAAGHDRHGHGLRTPADHRR